MAAGSITGGRSLSSPQERPELLLDVPIIVRNIGWNLGHGEKYGEGRAFANLALHLDVPAVLSDDS